MYGSRLNELHRVAYNNLRTFMSVIGLLLLPVSWIVSLGGESGITVFVLYCFLNMFAWMVGLALISFSYSLYTEDGWQFWDEVFYRPGQTTTRLILFWTYLPTLAFIASLKLLWWTLFFCWMLFMTARTIGAAYGADARKALWLLPIYYWTEAPKRKRVRARVLYREALSRTDKTSRSIARSNRLHQMESRADATVRDLEAKGRAADEAVRTTFLGGYN